VLLRLIHKLADPEFNKTVQKAFGLTFQQFFNKIYKNYDNVASDCFVWYYDSIYGNFWKFNSGKTQNGSRINLLEQKSTGYYYGILSVNFLDVFPSQIYNIINSFYGFSLGLKISIDNQDSIPLYFYNMLAIKPGTCTYINIKKMITRNLPYPYTNCHDLTNYHSVLYDKFAKLNKTYSQRACFQLCKQKKMIDACNCTIVSYPNVDNHPTCQSFEQLNCYNRQSLNLSGCDAYCPLECESVSYDFTITSDKYPDETNLVLLKASSEIATLFEKANVSLANASYDTVANSVACVYIYYQDFDTITIEQSRAMSEVKLFSIL
jgi:hypothetical protein